MHTPTPLPYDYLCESYGLHSPLVDGLTIARQLINKHIPDDIDVQHWSEDDGCIYTKTVNNDDKDRLLSELDRRIEEAKRGR